MKRGPCPCEAGTPLDLVVCPRGNGRRRDSYSRRAHRRQARGKRRLLSLRTAQVGDHALKLLAIDFAAGIALAQDVDGIRA